MQQLFAEIESLGDGPPAGWDRKIEGADAFLPAGQGDVTARRRALATLRRAPDRTGRQVMVVLAAPLFVLVGPSMVLAACQERPVTSGAPIAT